MSLLLDQSILPGFSNETTCKTCIPGDKLYAAADGYLAGTGCYEFHGAVYSAMTGFACVFSTTNAKGDEVKRVEVRRQSDKKTHAVPFQNSIVTARVEAVNLKYAKCSILCVEDTLLSHTFNSTLRKEDVREKEKDKVEIYRCVQPGDIILARVLGYGDNQTAYLLTIQEDELGVISGRAQTGERLVPHSAAAMKSPHSDYKEERKVAVIANPFTF